MRWDAYHESCCQEPILGQRQAKFSLQCTEALSVDSLAQASSVRAPTGSIKACLTTIPYAGRPSLLALSPFTPLLAMIPMKRHDKQVLRDFVQPHLRLESRCSLCLPRSMYTSIFMAQNSRSSLPGVNQEDMSLFRCKNVQCHLKVPLHRVCNGVKLQFCSWSRMQLDQARKWQVTTEQRSTSLQILASLRLPSTQKFTTQGAHSR